MRYTTATLLSAAVFTLGAFARPSPSPPADISTPLAKRWAGGWCTMHVQQYQKNQGPTAGGGNTDYRLTVSLLDALDDPLGGVNLLDAPGGALEYIDSQLPAPVGVEVGAEDADPVRFQYNGQSWDTTDSAHCGTPGAYDSGSRQFDCGFTC